jgi:hypothetical protein
MPLINVAEFSPASLSCSTCRTKRLKELGGNNHWSSLLGFWTYPHWDHKCGFGSLQCSHLSNLGLNGSLGYTLDEFHGLLVLWVIPARSVFFLSCSTIFSPQFIEVLYLYYGLRFFKIVKRFLIPMSLDFSWVSDMSFHRICYLCPEGRLSSPWISCRSQISQLHWVLMTARSNASTYDKMSLSICRFRAETSCCV